MQEKLLNDVFFLNSPKNHLFFLCGILPYFSHMKEHQHIIPFVTEKRFEVARKIGFSFAILSTGKVEIALVIESLVGSKFVLQLMETGRMQGRDLIWIWIGMDGEFCLEISF